MFNKTILALIIFAVIIDSALTLPTPNNDGEFTLRIVHTNDMHSRFEQTSKLSGQCSEKKSVAGECYGGFARLATLIRQARKSDNSTLFLNAGDTYQGTAWFTAHKWEIVSKFLNILKPDAISLGNHEFDDGPEGLIPFLNETTYPVVAANLDLSKEPELDKSLKKSVTLDVNGHKIGVIGYLTAETRTIAKTRNVIFLDEITEIRKEVKKLQAENTTILIALGHSGFEVDKKIAEEVDGIDLVIGGHTNTFLYTGQVPDSDIPDKEENLYPYTVLQKSGRKVYVVQAHAFTKYLGNLTIDFDIHGEIKGITGQPILLNSKIEQATDVLQELEKFRPKVNDLVKEEIGSSRVFLDGQDKSCRLRECNLGNLIADAMVYFGVANTSIAIINSGSIRSSIDKSPNEKITKGDVINTFPFENFLVKMKLPGKILLEALEWGASTLKPGVPSDAKAFLQVAGIQVTYNLLKSSGSKVVSVWVRCSECKDRVFEELDPNKEYDVMTIDYMKDGGDDFSMFRNLKWDATEILIADVLANYMKIKSPLDPSIEGRIKFTTEEKNCYNSGYNTTGNGASTKNLSVVETTTSNQDHSTSPKTTSGNGASTKKSSVVETIPSNQDPTPPKTTSGKGTSTNSGYKSSQSIVVMIALPMLAIFLVRS